jgi:hypothetical protein
MQWSRQVIMLGAVTVCLGVWGSAPQGQAQEMPCTEEIRTYCADVQPGQGRILRCLKQHESQLAPACVNRVAQLETTFSGTLAACREDWVAVCYHPHAGAGKGEVVGCLTASEAKLSKGCKDALRQVEPGEGRRRRDMP